MHAGRTLAIILAFAVTAGVNGGLWAPPALADQSDISVGGIWVSRITHDAAGYSASERAVEVNKRITEILSNPSHRYNGAAVTVRPNGVAAAIYVGDQLVFTVMPEDAAGTGVSPTELARQWAQRLSSGLSKALPDANIHTF